MTGKETALKDCLDFWRRLEFRKGVQGRTPPFTEDLITWLFRELHAAKTSKHSSGWKFTGKYDETKENDRITIGIPREKDGKVTRTAFALFPAKEGRLLFLFYAVDAQKSGNKSNESDLRKWLDQWKLPLVLSDCIFPGRKRVGREGDLGLDLPYERYAKIAIRDFDEGRFSVVRKSSKGNEGTGWTIRVPAADVLKLLLFEIEHRPRLDKRRTSGRAERRRSR